ncbi:alpha-L-fucosidase [Granulicella aggregans]|uniref:alpha-L-fucosidase n=1 Tax=Granulicella aggregans TaxID=474949 RepID=A0A7W8E1G9_9BACT|nr:alpha-L-fucosidase [Granulicella aggregans]MBB5055427.1 alpha-L-fucosidase [Granulicella aggregans]
MNRRQILLNSAQLGLVLAARKAFGQTAGASTARALPSPDQIAWQDLEVGMFVHFAPNTWQDVESDNLSTPLSVIDPKHLDTDQWARTAVALGAKYIVFVAKHQGGFCMWQTHTTDYSIRNTPWRDGKGDVLADVAASCRKFGLKLGVYVCPRDDHFGAKTGGICATPELQQRYNAMYREQLTEVLSRYGGMVEVWFDGSTAAPVSDILTKYQPHAMVFQGPSATIRWVGNEDGFAPNPCWNGISRTDAKSGTATSLNSDPDGDTWMPNEVDVSIRRPDWFWSTTNEKKVLTVDQLLTIYYCSVGRGCQLLLNIPVNRDGLLSKPDCDAAAGFGTQLRQRFAKPIAALSGSGEEILLSLPVPAKIDTVVLQEDTSKGERIRGYRIDGRTNGVWTELGTGTSIGHKRIQPVRPTTIDALRMVATVHKGTPWLRTFAAYNIGVAPPAGWDAKPQVWAANLAGSWRDGRFSLDLTSKIDSAKQYRLRFVPSSGEVDALRSVVLTLHGLSQPNLVKPVAGKHDELILDITEVGGAVQITGTVEGAVSGQVLLQKL